MTSTRRRPSLPAAPTSTAAGAGTKNVLAPLSAALTTLAWPKSCGNALLKALAQQKNTLARLWSALARPKNSVPRR